MKHWTISLCLLAVALGCLVSQAREHEGTRTNSVLLNGVWEFARGDGTECAETAAGQGQIQWQQVTLPGPFMAWSKEAANQTKFVWARRTFEVTPTQAISLAVLRWNRVASGAVAFINGQKVGENEPTGPFQVIVPVGVLKPGENQIVLRICGAGGVRKSRSGHALIPAGFGVGIPEVTDDVWIDFADMAYMKWVLALPETHVVVIWNATHLTEGEKRNAKALCDFAGRGGRVVVLSTPSWDWSELCEVKMSPKPRFSRVFPHTDLKNSLLEGVDHRWLNRWNGLPGTVAFGALEGAVMTRAEKMFWGREPKTTVMAAVPAASGDGRILFSQLDLQGRLDQSKPNYDPVAERVLFNLLGRGSFLTTIPSTPAKRPHCLPTPAQVTPLSPAPPSRMEFLPTTGVPRTMSRISRKQAI